MAKRNINTSNNNLTVGFLILVIGSVLLLQRIGVFFPGWLFSWPVLIIAIGAAILAKHRFQSGIGFFMMLLGFFFLLKREFNLPWDIGSYLVPVGLIVLGLYLMAFKRNRKYEQWEGWKNSGKEKTGAPFHTGIPKTMVKEAEGSGPQTASKEPEPNNIDGGDLLNSQALFCGIQKRVLSKNFYGGKISTFFGGTEIDLSQADIQDSAILYVDVAFGGVKLVVPSHWDIKIDVVNVFAGIEDKRMYSPVSSDRIKTMVIKGTVMFGGLEIKSF